MGSTRGSTSLITTSESLSMSGPKSGDNAWPSRAFAGAVIPTPTLEAWSVYMGTAPLPRAWASKKTLASHVSRPSLLSSFQMSFNSINADEHVVDDAARKQSRASGHICFRGTFAGSWLSPCLLVPSQLERASGAWVPWLTRIFLRLEPSQACGLPWARGRPLCCRRSDPHGTVRACDAVIRRRVRAST